MNLNTYCLFLKQRRLITLLKPFTFYCLVLNVISGDKTTSVLRTSIYFTENQTYFQRIITEFLRRLRYNLSTLHDFKIGFCDHSGRSIWHFLAIFFWIMLINGQLGLQRPTRNTGGANKPLGKKYFWGRFICI